MSDASTELFIQETSRIVGILARLMPGANRVAAAPAETPAAAPAVADIVAVQPALAELQPLSASALQHPLGAFFQQTAWETPSVTAQPAPVSAPAPSAAIQQPVPDKPTLTSEVARLQPVAAATSTASISHTGPSPLLSQVSGFFAETHWQGPSTPEVDQPQPSAALPAEQPLFSQALTQTTGAFFVQAKWQGARDSASGSVPSPARSSTAVATAPSPEEISTDSFFDDITWN